MHTADIHYAYNVVRQADSNLLVVFSVLAEEPEREQFECRLGDSGKACGEIAAGEATGRSCRGERVPWPGEFRLNTERRALQSISTRCSQAKATSR